MDIKCQNDSHCQYCMNRCSYCFQPATYGHTVEDSDGHVLQFCSDKCRDVACNPRASTRMHVIKLGTPMPSHLTPRCAPVAPTHMKLIHLFVGATGDKLKEHEIALCVGDETEDFPSGRMYVVYYSRTLKNQVALEFFVSESFEPEAPLPYLKASKNAHDIIAALKETAVVQKYLRLALPHMPKGYKEVKVQGKDSPTSSGTVWMGLQESNNACITQVP